MKQVKPHTINVDELLRWKSETKVLYASSSREEKRLFGNLNGGFEVEYKRKIIWEGKIAHRAVEVYNNIEGYLESERIYNS